MRSGKSSLDIPSFQFITTRYKGVFYRESTSRECSYGPDRCYVVWYKDAHGKPHWHTVGWHSDGIRGAYANEVRAGLTDKSLSPASPKSPGGALDPVADTSAVTVGGIMGGYFRWAEGEGKHVVPERNRYDKHLRQYFDAIPLESITLEFRKLVGGDIFTVEIGWPIGMPTCRPMGSGIFEVRTDLPNGTIARVLFCVENGCMYLLDGFVKKTQKTPQSNLELAKDRRREILATLKKEDSYHDGRKQ